MVLWSQITTGLGVVAIICYSPYLHYSSYQYVVAAILIFVSTNILEGTLGSVCTYLQGDYHEYDFDSFSQKQLL